MERRHWDSKKKLEIVLEGLKGGTSIGEICNKHQISQTQYYMWRDALLNKGHKIFELKDKTKEEDRLKKEVVKLKTIIGDLTTELKKNDYGD
jgi:transposase-like protein